ncbi:hypothetical protein Taro_017866 [Colocasia esculenta]|uniref:Uncharacterized protein n=1 Tax=Colocasia esculenta TaxID=4460 RepID=A0A843UHA0_COLES|nr:hypothetical protein [Colocasia esculenta]
MKTVTAFYSTDGVTAFYSTVEMTAFYSTAGMTAFYSTAEVTAFYSTVGMTAFYSTVGMTAFYSTTGVTAFYSTAGVTAFCSTVGVTAFYSTAGVTAFCSTAGVTTFYLTFTVRATALYLTFTEYLGSKRLHGSAGGERCCPLRRFVTCICSHFRHASFFREFSERRDRAPSLFTDIEPQRWWNLCPSNLRFWYLIGGFPPEDDVLVCWRETSPFSSRSCCEFLTRSPDLIDIIWGGVEFLFFIVLPQT